MRHLFIMLILISLYAGCTHIKEDMPPVDNGLIFQFEYTNHAWGYQHNGWMLDYTGKVRRFQKQAIWVFPDSKGYISETDMDKNLAACDSVIRIIPLPELANYAAKAIPCLTGPFSASKNTMADAGERIYAIFRYEASEKRYKQVILNMKGDWSQENLAANVNEVVKWMEGI